MTLIVVLAALALLGWCLWPLTALLPRRGRHRR